MEKLTKKDWYNEVKDLVALAKEQEFEGFDLDGMVEFCDKEIAALDHKAEKAREKAAEKAAEGDALAAAVATVLTDEMATIADITAQVAVMEGFEDATIGKVTYRLRTLVANGKAQKGEVVIPATETSKKRTVVGYALPGEVDTDAE